MQMYIYSEMLKVKEKQLMILDIVIYTYIYFLYIKWTLLWLLDWWFLTQVIVLSWVESEFFIGVDIEGA